MQGADGCYAAGMQATFLPFLPQDASDGMDPAAEEVAELIAEDLQRLLRLDDSQFANVLCHNSSLQLCVTSYLQNCRQILAHALLAHQCGP